MKRGRTTFRASALLLTAALLCAASCRAAIVYVNKDAPGSTHDGISWATSFSSVTAGLNVAMPGDEVWVAAGMYKEAGSYYYKSLNLKSGVGLFGGFVGTETSRGQRDPTKNVTVLDGEQLIGVVKIAADATSDTVLDGFTIQNGWAFDATGSGGMGGGVYVGGGTPIIAGNIIKNCAATGGTRTTPSYGGGIFVAGGTPLITGNTVTGNGAIYGGGIYALGGLVRDNFISANEAGPGYRDNGTGGGLYLFAPAVAIHNVVSANSAPGGYGGGGGAACVGGFLADNLMRDNVGQNGACLECSGNSTVISNTLVDSSTSVQFFEVGFAGGKFANNLLDSRSGDGLYLGYSGSGDAGGSQPIIANNTFIQTGPSWTAVQPAALVSWYGNGEMPVVANNIVLGWHTPGYTVYASGTPPIYTTDHNDVFGNTDNTLAFPGASQIGENFNLSLDPLFVNAAGGDYRLQAGSPCIDAGNDTYVASGDRDLAGAPRIYGAHVDIGAYEYGSPLYTVADAAEVLRIAAGISIGTPAEVSRLNVVPASPGLTLAHATRIAQWLLE